MKVPESAAKLTRPILDSQRQWLDCSRSPASGGCDIRTQNERQSAITKLLYTVTKNQTKAADEALVVLTCFDIGESQEEADAIIARGTRMLPLIEKYRNASPVLPQREYPQSMLRSDKQEHFKGLVYAIRHHLRGTWDNPEG